MFRLKINITTNSDFFNYKKIIFLMQILNTLVINPVFLLGKTLKLLNIYLIYLQNY